MLSNGRAKEKKLPRKLPIIHLFTIHSVFSQSSDWLDHKIEWCLCLSRSKSTLHCFFFLLVTFLCFSSFGVYISSVRLSLSSVSIWCWKGPPQPCKVAVDVLIQLSVTCTIVFDKSLDFTHSICRVKSSQKSMASTLVHSPLIHSIEWISFLASIVNKWTFYDQTEQFWMRTGLDWSYYYYYYRLCLLDSTHLQIFLVDFFVRDSLKDYWKVIHAVFFESLYLYRLRQGVKLIRLLGA